MDKKGFLKRNAKNIALVIASVCAITSMSAFAYDKYVQEVDFKINLNGRDVDIDQEIVTIDDRTYLPLRAMCEQLMGIDVTWHDDTDTIELWNITKPIDRGSHEAPITHGSPVTGEFEAKDDTFVNYSISIDEVTRGQSVYDWAKKQYMSVNPLDTGDLEGEKLQKKIEDYNEKVDEYMQKLVGGTDYELVRAKIHIDILPSASTFEYTTKESDFTPYCGTVTVNGMDRQYVEYSVPKAEGPSDIMYAGRTILTNGIQEGYMVFRVYKADTTPRVKYKDGQYLALY